MAKKNHTARVDRSRVVRSWFDEHSTTIVTVAVCAIAVGIVAFGASQIFAAREIDDARLQKALLVRDNVEGLEALYAEADADFLRLVVDPDSHAEPWPVERITQAETAFGTLEQAFANTPERLTKVDALRNATHEWQRRLAQSTLGARTTGNTVTLQRDALLAVDETRHRVATGLRSLDATEDLSAGGRASQLARRHASERVAFAAAATAAFVFLVYGFLVNHRIGLERARARIAAEEGEVRFREYFEEHPLPMLIYDVDTLTVAAANDAAVRQYGYTREEFEQLPIGALRPREDEPQFLALFAELASKPGKPSGSPGVLRHMHRDGTLFFVEPTFHFLTFANRRACFVVAINVTEKEHAKEALQESKQMLEAVIDSVPQRIFWKDTNSRYLGCNRGFTEDVGLGDASQVIGLTDYDLPWHTSAASARRRDREVIATGKPLAQYEEFSPAANGVWRWLRKTKVPLRNARDEVIGLLATYEDVTERKRVELALRLRSRALDAIVNAVLITRSTESGNLIEYANPAFERITGYSIDAVIGTDCRFLQGDDRDQDGIESIRRALAEEREVATLLRNYRHDGTLFWNQIYIAPVRDENGQITHHISVVNDVTELVQSRDLLCQQANVDSLTALPNRNRLNDRLAQAIRDAQATGTRVALVFMDVDHFKDVNDSLGHGVGDRLLQEIGARLSACVGEADTVARYGGDEFVMLVSEGGTQDRLTEVLARVSQAFARPVWIDDTEFHVETSIGIATYPTDGSDAETLLRRADLAMYRAKSNGRNGVQRFTPELGKRADERLALSRRMRTALANGEFRLDYQPQIDLETNRVTGVEALLRWRDAELGPVSPATFIPIAEENGLIVPIGEWVMQQACFQAQVWQATLPGLRMSVNLSPRQFARGDIVRVIQHALALAQLPAHLLELEITEGALLHLGSLDVLRALRATGIDIAIDDFGTGYSSLSYIRNFHAERLKLDMSFVRGIGVHREDEVITRAILSLGRALGFKVVAEGVETDTQLAFLRRHGCNVVQGYRFARPMQAAEAHNFILQFNEGSLAYS
ncbi:sensor domain-containing protein [Trinickia fusca]|uniref:EAL domain-containing protein n=1 Tax=Trinickia fusca TaxID=2419777 RepID=A0A494XCY5_9BURK|nr:EAL domain-containing protein [Trinickia fusca]RKP48358.1 EAL domain-containing protein [Trinickia fusca]